MAEASVAAFLPSVFSSSTSSSSSSSLTLIHPPKSRFRSHFSSFQTPRQSLPPKAAGTLAGVPELANTRIDDASWFEYGPRAAKKGNPPITPAIVTPGGPMDISSVMLRNRIIFIGQPVNSQVAQRVISQLMTLAAVDENEDIKMYINCPGGSTYSVLAIYDCMSWIKPKVSTVCFGIAASQGALLLAGGEKGKRFAMPNARIMIHQPQGGCGGTMDDVRRQVNEVIASRDKIDKMYAAFTGQPVEHVQKFTDRDRFFSAAEAMEFGLIDGLLETEY